MPSFREAAIQILSCESPLHYREITRRAINQGVLDTAGRTPEFTMNATLTNDIRFNGNQSSFVRVSEGEYALRDPNPTPNNSNNGNGRNRNIVPNSQYIGKAGEFYVASELLFRGYNASIMSLDEGMDIIALKNNKLFSIQVKTSNLHRNNSYVFDIRRVALDRIYAGNIFYIFVMIETNQRKSSIILPNLRIDELIDSRAITEVSNNRFRLTCRKRRDSIYIGPLRLEQELNFYWDHWEIMR
ncbi:MAG: HTH domain-containing protein [Flavobacteriaceae bacterium]|nr:HTH domain-containing protein [Flavobacteriaceae bacterium]MCY4299578.1 HTH domain-containing protein [Flavobacteriaceae bacterium]